MPTYEDTCYAGILHSFRHMNRERRAGLTRCGMYVEFRPTLLLEAAPTCVPCVGYVPPECICALIGRNLSEDERLAGHDPGCSVVEGFDAIEERIEDIVRWCIQGGTHNVECDADGFCQDCGYQFDDANTQRMKETL